MGIFFKGYSYVGVGGWVWRDDSGWHGEGRESIGRCGEREEEALSMGEVGVCCMGEWCNEVGREKRLNGEGEMER